MDNPKKNIQKNPKPGSVVYCEMSNVEDVDFLLVSQKVDKGCATPCQYRLAFYKPQNAPFRDGSFAEVDLPLNAIAQLTFEQCYNYYNWIGSIRVPAVLQYSRKLANLNGEYVGSSVNVIDFKGELVHDLMLKPEYRNVEGDKEL